MSGQNPRPAGRWNHLYALWEASLALDPLPQFDRWLAAEMKRHPQFGRRDRAWYAERLFGALRHGAWALLAQQAAERGGGAMADWPAEIARLAAAFPDYAAMREGWRRMGAPALFALLEGRRADQSPRLDHALDPAWIAAGESLRNAADSPDAGIALHCAAAGVPQWWVPALERRAAGSGWSDDVTRQFFTRLESRPPLWLRVHRERDIESVKRELLAAGFKIIVEDGPALAVSGTRGILALDCHKRGRAAIQDWASQQAGRRVAARPGDVVWDACAGGGGKTLQIAAALDSRGLVVASDVRAHALDEALRRAGQAGFTNVSSAAWDGGALPSFGPEIGARGGFDRVLVDAPCSSAGVWRRNPDAMLRFTPDQAAHLAETQGALLANAAQALCPGGSLVYVTCSWLVEENEDVVEKFLTAHDRFNLVSMEFLGSPAADSDTLFAAVILKKDIISEHTKKSDAS